MFCQVRHSEHIQKVLLPFDFLRILVFPRNLKGRKALPLVVFGTDIFGEKHFRSLSFTKAIGKRLLIFQFICLNGHRIVYNFVHSVFSYFGNPKKKQRTQKVTFLYIFFSHVQLISQRESNTFSIL